MATGTSLRIPAPVPQAAQQIIGAQLPNRRHLRPAPLTIQKSRNTDNPFQPAVKHGRNCHPAQTEHLLEWVAQPNRDQAGHIPSSGKQPPTDPMNLGPPVDRANDAWQPKLSQSGGPFPAHHANESARHFEHKSVRLNSGDANGFKVRRRPRADQENVAGQ